MTFLLFINQDAMYEEVNVCPDIQVMPVKELQLLACNGAECPVQAYYDRQAKAVYLSRELDLDYSYDRSILLHELVHYVQDINDKWEEDINECRSAIRREWNAFIMQEKYLLEKNIRIPVSRQLSFYRC
ncbi:MAG: hypothetical protein D8M62_10430 [Proteobacteria bacterium]|nr:hypothetical protein [Pseudomonadota bacterium]